MTHATKAIYKWILADYIKVCESLYVCIVNKVARRHVLPKILFLIFTIRQICEGDWPI